MQKKGRGTSLLKVEGFVLLTFRIETVEAQKRRNAAIFESTMGEVLDYDNPQSFNQKLNWLKFYWRDPLITRCSAKDTVREYVLEVLGSGAKKYLTNLVGEEVYFRVDDINFEALPDKFVLKANNGSGTNIVCPNKSKLDIQQAKHKLSEWMAPANNYFYHKYEWGYKNIKPAIVCEEFLGNYGEVRDYKLFCFNGEPKFVYVSNEFDDHKKHIDMDYLTLEWKPTGYIRKSYKPPKTPFPRPDSLDVMVDLSKKLARPFPFVRVDFFEVEGVPKVVEMTFYPSGGTGAFENIEHDYEIGDMLRLPKPKNKASVLDLLWG